MVAEPVQQGTVEVRGRQVPVTTAGPGDGDLVLLLHGFPQTRRSWDLVVPRLADGGLRVVAPDQRGYAPGSPQAVGDYVLPALVGDVLALLDALDADRAHVVGHDWGGAVAWQVAARHPDRVQTVSSVTTPHPIAFTRALRHDLQAKLRFSYAALLQLPGSHRVLGAADGLVLRTWMRAAGLPADGDLLTDTAMLRTACHWYRAFDGTALRDLPDVAVPSLLLTGRHDPVFTAEAAEASARWCTAPHTHIEVPDAGHWLPETHPEVVAAAVLDRIAA